MMFTPSLYHGGSMKNRLKFLGIIAVAAIAGFTITACDSQIDPGANVTYWTVTWHLNGGEWPEEADPPVQVNKGEALAKPSPDPVKAAHNFGGWYTDALLSDRYNFSRPLSGNLVLYARWNSIYWNVIWELNGGSWTEEIPSELVDKGEVLDRPQPDPSKDGYTFAGWYSDATFTAEYDFTEPVIGDFTLYAAWERIYWIVTWELNGGMLAGELPERVEFDAVLANPGEPVKADHTFLGWYSDAGFSAEYTFSAPVTADLELYAAWDSLYKNIVWALDGGTTAATLPARVAKDAVLPKPSPDPSKPGNTFLGWYSDAGLSTEYTFSAPVTIDLTLYAAWDPEIFIISWELSGGTTTATLPIQAAYGAVLTRPNPNPTKDGYIFRGWYTDSELTTLYTFSLPVTNNLNLYARWEQSVVESGARYLAFTSDIHWSSGSSSAPIPIYEQWMDKLMTQIPSLDYMGFCGDLAIPTETSGTGNAAFWNNVETLMDTAEKYVDNGFITGTNSGLLTDGNLFGLGNHEWYNPSGGGNLAGNPTGYAQDRLMPNHTVIDEGDYIIYALGPVPGGTGGCAQQFVQTEIDTLSDYLVTAPSNVPIFIMAHHPIHGYPGGTPLRLTANADVILEMLNDYPNVFFMWGHNHSIPDPYWDTYHVAGDPIVTVYGASPSYTPGPEQTLNFTYFAPGAMRDNEYSGDSGDTGKYVKGKGTIAKIENGQVTLTYYDNECAPLEGAKYSGDTVINPVTVTIQGGGGPVIPRFTVTFDKNGGDTEASPRTKTVTSPATTVGTLPAEPTRAGYDFTGWNTQPNGSGATFTASTPVTVGITVYAQWAAVTIVTFDKNGGTTEANPRTIRVDPPATNVGTLPAEPTRTGYTFTGWKTQANGSGTSFTATTTVTTSITVYAQWTLKPYVPGDPYIVDLSGQTTRVATAANNDGGSVRLEFPAGFDVTSYSKFTITLDFLDSSQSRIATTTSQYLAADFFKNWTGASTRPETEDRLQTVSPTGVSDNNSGDVNNGFTFTRSSAFNVNPEGLWVQRAGGNSLRYIEILEIRFHNDP